MKLIYIKSTITPKDYSVVREILKKERGEKLAPFIYKLKEWNLLLQHLNAANVSYEIYQSIKINQKERLKERELAAAYQDFAKNKKIKKELAIWDEAVGDGIKNE
ncbi:MAG: hypothetical protein MRERV_47c008 [Mycoplasmataceae bacterium RV_VA103A]|nr:MAG: hypothetical protein MRERV_47c008 [Mycoplasmataceae bacterium RV_VA103A]